MERDLSMGLARRRAGPQSLPLGHLPRTQRLFRIRVHGGFSINNIWPRKQLVLYKQTEINMLGK